VFTKAIAAFVGVETAKYIVKQFDMHLVALYRSSVISRKISQKHSDKFWRV